MPQNYLSIPFSGKLTQAVPEDVLPLPLLSKVENLRYVKDGALTSRESLKRLSGGLPDGDTPIKLFNYSDQLTAIGRRGVYSWDKEQRLWKVIALKDHTSTEVFPITQKEQDLKTIAFVVKNLNAYLFYWYNGQVKFKRFNLTNNRVMEVEGNLLFEDEPSAMAGTVYNNQLWLIIARSGDIRSVRIKINSDASLSVESNTGFSAVGGVKRMRVSGNTLHFINPSTNAKQAVAFTARPAGAPPAPDLTISDILNPEQDSNSFDNETLWGFRDWCRFSFGGRQYKVIWSESQGYFTLNEQNQIIAHTHSSFVADEVTDDYRIHYTGEAFTHNGKVYLPLLKTGQIEQIEGSLNVLYPLGVELLEIDLNPSKAPQIAEIGKQALVSGGVNSYFNGTQLVEYGFAERPELEKTPTEDYDRWPYGELLERDLPGVGELTPSQYVEFISNMVKRESPFMVESTTITAKTSGDQIGAFAAGDFSGAASIRLLRYGTNFPENTAISTYGTLSKIYYDSTEKALIAEFSDVVVGTEHPCDVIIAGQLYRFHFGSFNSGTYIAYHYTDSNPLKSGESYPVKIPYCESLGNQSVLSQVIQAANAENDNTEIQIKSFGLTRVIDKGIIHIPTTGAQVSSHNVTFDNLQEAENNNSSSYESKTTLSGTIGETGIYSKAVYQDKAYYLIRIGGTTAQGNFVRNYRLRIVDIQTGNTLETKNLATDTNVLSPDRAGVLPMEVRVNEDGVAVLFRPTGLGRETNYFYNLYDLTTLNSITSGVIGTSKNFTDWFVRYISNTGHLYTLRGGMIRSSLAGFTTINAAGAVNMFYSNGFIYTSLFSRLVFETALNFLGYNANTGARASNKDFPIESTLNETQELAEATVGAGVFTAVTGGDLYKYNIMESSGDRAEGFVKAGYKDKLSLGSSYNPAGSVNNANVATNIELTGVWTNSENDLPGDNFYFAFSTDAANYANGVLFKAYIESLITTIKVGNFNILLNDPLVTSASVVNTGTVSVIYNVGRLSAQNNSLRTALIASLTSGSFSFVTRSGVAERNLSVDTAIQPTRFYVTYESSKEVMTNAIKDLIIYRSPSLDLQGSFRLPTIIKIKGTDNSKHYYWRQTEDEILFYNPEVFDFFSSMAGGTAIQLRQALIDTEVGLAQLLRAFVYKYKARYKWVDDTGVEHRSGWSNEIQLFSNSEIGVEGNQPSFFVSNLHLTTKNNEALSIEIYRTANRLNVFKFLKEVSNDFSVEKNSFTDDQIDRNLGIGGGGDSILISGAKYCENYLGRYVLYGFPEKKNRFVVSSPIQAFNNSAVEFRSSGAVGDLIEILMEDEITCIRPMDQYLLIFTTKGVFSWRLNEASVSQVYPESVTGLVGITAKDGLSAYGVKDGVLFSSNKGLWGVSRSLGSSYTGRDVQDFKGNIIEIQELKDREEVMLLTDSRDHPTLVYNYRFKKWSVFNDFNLLSLTPWDTSFAVAAKNKEVLVSSESENSSVRTGIETGWINLQQLQGYQRLREVVLLADFSELARLSVSFSYDFSEILKEKIDFNTASLTPDAKQFRFQPRTQKCRSFKLGIRAEAKKSNFEGLRLGFMALKGSYLKSSRKV